MTSNDNEWVLFAGWINCDQLQMDESTRIIMVSSRPVVSKTIKKPFLNQIPFRSFTVTTTRSRPCYLKARLCPRLGNIIRSFKALRVPTLCDLALCWPFSCSKSPEASTACDLPDTRTHNDLQRNVRRLHQGKNESIQLAQAFQASRTAVLHWNQLGKRSLV